MTAKISENYRKQIDRLAERVTAQGEAANQGSGTSQWMTPDGWELDPVENSGQEMHAPFNRDEPNDDFIDAIDKAQGTSGDMVVSTLQIDTLAQLERAYRARHITRVRSAIHAAGRLEIHGRDGGVFKRTHRAFLERLLKQSTKEE